MAITVQSLGSLKELNVDLWPKPSTSLTFYDRYTYAYETIYQTQPAVRTVNEFLGRNIAQLGLHLYRRLSDTDRQRVTDHPLARLLDMPNPVTTRYRLIDATVQDVGVFGNAYWLKLPVGTRQPRQLLRLPPQYVSLEGGFEPTKYTLSISGQQFEYAPSSVVHFRNHNPQNIIRGVSPLEALRRVLAEEHAAGQWREGFWRRGALISGYLERPADAPEWDVAARDRFLKDFKAVYSGAEQGGGIPLLEDGMTFKAATATAQESEYLLGRKFNLETVARHYHIPLPMIGILDHASFSNIREQHKNLYQDCLMPWCEMIQQEIELQLMPDFPDTADLYLEFNIAAKLSGSFEEQALSLQSAVGAPWMTVNEARARMNLPTQEGGDQLIVPLNVTKGGQASPRDSGSQNRTGNDRAAVLQRFIDRQARVLKSNGGRYDAERWQRELAADLEMLEG